MTPRDTSAALKLHDPAYQPWERPAGLSSDLAALAPHFGYTAGEMALEWLERASIRVDGGMERRAAERAAIEDCKRMLR